MKRFIRRSNIISLALFLFCLTLVNGGTKKTWETEDSTRLFDKATARFQDKLGPDKFESFQKSAVVYTLGPKQTDKVGASELVYHYAIASDTRSSVEISTSKGTGAIIRYQTLGQRVRNETPTTAKQLTALTERIYIGRYYIWSVRDDKITSDPNSEFEIVSQTEKVTLQEK